jgi:hypothetical protein
MEMKNEKPTLYFITGHRAAGKTQLLQKILPDDLKLSPIHQYNDRLRNVSERYSVDQDLHTYIEGLKKVHHSTDKYIDQQVARKQDIYLEADGLSIPELANFKHRTKEQYDVHAVFVLCHKFANSLNRVQQKLNTNLSLHVLDTITRDHRYCDHLLNFLNPTLAKKIDLYDGTNGLKLLASFDNGKLIKVSPEIMTKIWFQQAGSLGQEIRQYMDEQSKTVLKKQSEKQTIEERQTHQNQRQRRSKGPQR